MRRVAELDSLRAIAAIVVIWLHAGTISASFRSPIVMIWGSTAVDLFFVISGYLITTIILKEKDSAGFFARFYTRRSLRIWPIYYLAIFGFVALNLALSRPYPMDGLAYYLTYTQKVPHYWFAEDPPFCKGFAHTWSLAVEEQFYLIWPGLVCLAGRKRLVPVTVAMMGLAIVARGWWGLDYQLLVTRCDGLALGGLLAVLLADPERLRLRIGRYRIAFILLAVACLAALIGINVVFRETIQGNMGASQKLPGIAGSLALFTFNLLFFALVGICVSCAGHPAMRVLRNRWLCYLGTISYGLYLYHNFIFSILQKLTGREDQPLPVILGGISLTLGAAVVSWEYLERPILAWKDRFRYGAPKREVVVEEVPVLGPVR